MSEVPVPYAFYAFYSSASSQSNDSPPSILHFLSPADFIPRRCFCASLVQLTVSGSIQCFARSRRLFRAWCKSSLGKFCLKSLKHYPWSQSFRIHNFFRLVLAIPGFFGPRELSSSPTNDWSIFYAVLASPPTVLSSSLSGLSVSVRSFDQFSYNLCLLAFVLHDLQVMGLLCFPSPPFLRRWSHLPFTVLLAYRILIPCCAVPTLFHHVFLSQAEYLVYCWDFSLLIRARMLLTGFRRLSFHSLSCFLLYTSCYLSRGCPALTFDVFSFVVASLFRLFIQAQWIVIAHGTVFYSDSDGRSDGLLHNAFPSTYNCLTSSRLISRSSSLHR